MWNKAIYVKTMTVCVLKENGNEDIIASSPTTQEIKKKGRNNRLWNTCPNLPRRGRLVDTITKKQG